MASERDNAFVREGTHMSVEVTYTTHLPRLITGWDTLLEAIVEKVANDVLASAQALAPVKTGYLRNSGRVEPGEDRFSRYVHFTANYAAYLEFGTRYMHPRPYLTPAVEHERGNLQNAFSALNRLATV